MLVIHLLCFLYRFSNCITICQAQTLIVYYNGNFYYIIYINPLKWQEYTSTLLITFLIVLICTLQMLSATAKLKKVLQILQINSSCMEQTKGRKFNCSRSSKYGHTLSKDHFVFTLTEARNFYVQNLFASQ